MPCTLIRTFTSLRLPRHARPLIALTALVLLAGCAMPAGPSQATSLTWRQATLPDGHALPRPTATSNSFAISPADGQRAWVCAPGGNRPGAFTVWATHDAATTWQQVSMLAPQALETPQRCGLIADQYDPHTLIAALGSGNCNSCPSPGSLLGLLSTDAGATWQPLSGIVGLQGIEELATNNGTVYAVIEDLYHVYLVTITSAGGVLSMHPTGVPALAPSGNIIQLWMHPPDGVLYVEDTGARLWRSDDAGTHWMALSEAPSTQFLGRWIEPQHHWLFCVKSSDVAKGSEVAACSDDAGQSWPPRLTQDISRGCAVGDITADGWLLAACADDPNASQPRSFTLTRFAPGAVDSRQIGTVPSYHFVLTATGQIWAYNPAGDEISVATLAG